ncbi:hypothetical protein [Microbacterium sp. p3-SID336]|uniref:hypothetical protein n=1 Tax=Microbacterium sp. p3-SID336 TaxID=2916212 RepID=UPI0021A47528|nr:hypothetical protein [Microbacterium sp. p3-SID336]MCT1478797.1 hypothetical protein [Microbacterium sp. p3-SID336]
MGFEVRNWLIGFNRPLRPLAVAGVGLLLGAGAGVGAAPSSSQPDPAAVEAVASADPLAVSAVVDDPLLVGRTTELTVNEHAVEVSSDPSRAVAVGTGDDMVEIALPFSDAAGQGLSTQAGTVTFDNTNETSSVVLLREDGSVQVATVIESDSAPSRFEPHSSRRSWC